MNIKNNIIGLLSIVMIFASYHTLQPMDDGFSNLVTDDYEFKKHGVENNQHAKLKDKGQGKFYLHAGDDNDVRAVFTFQRDGQLLLRLRVRGGDSGTFSIKHNHKAYPEVEISSGRTAEIPLTIHQDDDLEVILKNNQLADYDKIQLNMYVKSNWFQVQNQLIPLLWIVLFVFLWGKKHTFIALNTYVVFLLLLTAQKLNFGSLSFHEVLIYLLLSFALAFGSVFIHQELAWLRKYKVTTILNSILAFIMYAIPTSFIIYVLNFDAEVGSDDLNAVFQTNGLESIEYILDFVDLQYIAMVAGLVALVGILLHLQESQETGKIEKSLLILLTVTFLSISLSQLSTLALPKFISQSFDTYNHELKLFREVQDKRKSGQISFTADKPQSHETYIVLIGESLNKKNMGLYGYLRETTPNLSSMNATGELLVFQQAYANYSYTIKALQLALTEANQYNEKNYYDSLSIVDILKQADVETYWLTNQVIYGGWDNMVSVIANEAEHMVALNHTVGKHTRTQQLDDALIDELKQVLAKKTNKNKVIFVHLMGSHGSYSSRYPKAFAKFQGDLDRGLFGDLADASDSKQRKINAYDNSILYNDYVVSEVIQSLKQTDGVSGLLYLADHADDALAGKGHHSSKFNFHMLQIPMLAWFSDEYKAMYSKTYLTMKGNRDAIFSNDLLYDTLLGFMHVKTNRYEPIYDLSNTSYALTIDEALALHGKKKFNDKKNYIWWQRHNIEYLRRQGLVERVIPHGVNSVGVLKDVWRDGSRAFEVDVLLDEGIEKLRIGKKKGSLGFILSDFLQEVPTHEIQRVWLELNALTHNNIQTVLHQLEVLDKQLHIKERMLIESDIQEPLFNLFAKHGWKTTYYLPIKEIKHHLETQNTQALKQLAKKLQWQLQQQQVSGISFDEKVYGFVKQYLEPIIPKHIRYYAWGVPALKSPSFQKELGKHMLYRDKRVDLLLTRYKSQY